MTHTSTEQPEALPEDLKLAEILENEVWQATPMRLSKVVELSAEAIRRLHARVQALEAELEATRKDPFTYADWPM